MQDIPAEMVLEVIGSLEAEDVARCRLVCSKFNNVITRNKRKLRRSPFSVKICGTDNLIIEHNKIGFVKKEREEAAIFDFSLWNGISIELIELEDLTATPQLLECLVNVVETLRRSRQTKIRGFVARNVKLTEEFTEVLVQLVDVMSCSVKKYILEDCNLPSFLFPEHVTQTTLDHYRWLNCTGTCPANDTVISKYTEDMDSSIRNFHGELDQVQPATAVAFMKKWLTSPNSPYFNLAIYGCDEHWKQQFVAECARSSLTHYCFEFPSKTHSTAHIKVTFLEESYTCRIWPIFDVPARTAGQTVCYARYFRDF